jgi:hypothetical protein
MISSLTAQSNVKAAVAIHRVKRKTYGDLGVWGQVIFADSGQ